MKIRDILQTSAETLTVAERKISTVLLADYPFAGLLTVAELAKRSNVSSPTILRLITKLGFDNYSAFQKALIGELKERNLSPLIVRETRGARESRTPFLASLAERVTQAVNETVTLVPEKQLDAVSALLSDHRRSIFMIGGRLTDAFAMFFHHYLCQIRPNVYKVSSFHEEWPEFLLRMNRKDVVVMFDCRRYQPDLLMFAERSARDRGCQIVLLTDKWLSPIAKHSVHILPASVEVDTPWDTGTSVLFLVEALINRVAEADWSKTRKRIKSWEAFRISLQAARPDEG